MKKVFVVTLAVILILALCACGSNEVEESTNSPIEDFEYELKDGVAIIVGYTGTDMDIIIPSEVANRPVTIIAQDAFKEYDMKSIVIPESVVRIEGYAFYGCKLLEKVTLPSKLEYLGGAAFGACESLVELDLPDHVYLETFDRKVSNTRAVEWMHSPVSGNTSVIVSEGSAVLGQIEWYMSVDRIYGTINYLVNKGDNLLDNEGIEESPLTDFEYIRNEGDRTINNRYWSKDGIEITKYLGNQDEVIIPREIDGLRVTAIGASAFEGCEVEEIYLHDGIVRVDKRAFADCKMLNSVVFSDAEILIMEDAFTGCELLDELELPFNAWFEVSEEWAEDWSAVYNVLIAPVSETDETVLIIQKDSYIHSYVVQEITKCDFHYKIE